MTRQELDAQALTCQRNAALAYEYAQQGNWRNRARWQHNQAWWASEAMRYLDMLINGGEL